MNMGKGRFADRSVSAGLDCTEGFRGFGVDDRVRGDDPQEAEAESDDMGGDPQRDSPT